MLNFNAAKHEYRKDGLLVPGVTTVLNNVGLSDFSMVPEKVLQLAAERGTRVHKATELEDLGTLDPETIDKEINLFLVQWRKFLVDYNVEILAVEQRIYNPKFKYAGTLDRILVIKGEVSVLDIKTGVKSDSHGPQTAAYEHAFRKKIKSRKRLKRYTLYLKKGGYKLDPNKDIAELDVFLSALQIYNYKRRN